MNDLGLMCMLALEAPVALDPQAILAALSDTAPRSNVAVEPRTGAEDTRGLFVTIDRQDFAVIAEDCAIPDPALVEAIEHSGFWRNRRAVLAQHRAMIAISATERATGHGLLRAQAVALTRLAAAVATTAPALALCWVSAATVVPAVRLAQAIDEIKAERWPVDLWIGCIAQRTRDATKQRLAGARSRGAAGYFGAEIEIFPFATSDLSEPAKIILNTAGYLMAHGSHLRAGQVLQLPGGRRMGFDRLPATDGDPALIRLQSIPPGEPGAA